MADQQKDHRWKALLQPIPGWEMHSPGKNKALGPAPAKSAPPPVSAKPQPIRPPERPPVAFQRLKVKATPAAQAHSFKMPHINFPSIDLGRLFSKLRLPAIKPAWVIGGSVALAAGLSLVTLFTRQSAPDPVNVADNSVSGPITGTGPVYTPPWQPPLPTPPSSEAPTVKPLALSPTPSATQQVEIDNNELLSPIDGYEMDNFKPRRGFGYKYHPVHRAVKHHDGVDFPAARKTPVYAVSDGVISNRDWETGYGKTIRIGHSKSAQTLYAHLDGYARGIKRGTKVTQGQLIGYVGCTGICTAPHLHFEIILNGRQVDPLKVTSLPYEELKVDSGLALKIPDVRKIFRNAGDNKTDDKIKDLILTSSGNEGLHPELMYRLFGKEAGRDRDGSLRVNIRSDRGALGLCQFTEEQFLSTMKRHGERLGYPEYAKLIRSYVGEDKRTYYTADKNEQKILNLRSQPEIAIPVCAAHVREDLDYLRDALGRVPNFTDSSLSHYTGKGSAVPLMRAYANQATRRNLAYKYVSATNLDGPTNMSVFFEGGDRSRPYTVEQVYNAKRRIMGTKPALIADQKPDFSLASFKFQ